MIHSDHGSQFTSWAFTENVRRLGLISSMGTVGDCYDNAPMESFWGSMQIELLNRQKWRTNLELAIAMADYIEHFYNSRPPPQLARLSHPERIRSFTLKTHPAGHFVLKSGPPNGVKRIWSGCRDLNPGPLDPQSLRGDGAPSRAIPNSPLTWLYSDRISGQIPLRADRSGLSCDHSVTSTAIPAESAQAAPRRKARLSLADVPPHMPTTASLRLTAVSRHCAPHRASLAIRQRLGRASTPPLREEDLRAVRSLAGRLSVPRRPVDEILEQLVKALRRGLRRHQPLDSPAMLHRGDSPGLLERRESRSLARALCVRRVILPSDGPVEHCCEGTADNPRRGGPILGTSSGRHQ